MPTGFSLCSVQARPPPYLPTQPSAVVPGALQGYKQLQLPSFNTQNLTHGLSLLIFNHFIEIALTYHTICPFNEYKSAVACSQSCTTISTIHFRTFYHTKKKPCTI